jgi:hypothetical protein
MAVDDGAVEETAIELERASQMWSMRRKALG